MPRPLAMLALTVLLVGCATEQQQEGDQWTGRTVYPPEVCWRLYTPDRERTAEYWHIRRWCDQRETKSDPFI